MLNWLPCNEKYTSKMVSNAFQCALFLTSVAARAYLNASRSSSGMCCTASIASRFSVRLTGSPAERSSWMNPARTSSIPPARWAPAAPTLMAPRASGRTPLHPGRHRRLAARSLGHRAGELLARLGDVGLVLQQDVQRLFGLLGVDAVDAEQDQRAGPVERLRYRRVLLELEAAY